jgi:hypothetical protein
LPKNADFLRFFWVSTISRGSNQETLERLYRTRRSFVDTLMRSIHSGFPWVFAGFSDPADATDSAHAVVRATTARLASRRQSVEPRRHEKCFSESPNLVPVSQVALKPLMCCAIVETAEARWHVALDQRRARPGAGALINLGRRGPLTPGGPRSAALAGLQLDALALASRSIVVHNY